MKNVKKVLGCLRKADNDYDLIHDGDKICVGISGGKDSSVLLYCLNLYKLFSKKNYEILGIYCDLGFGNEGFDQLVEYFEQLGVKILRCETQIADILRLHLDKQNRIECSLCSKLRKGAVINFAKQYGCNKIAFGHHSDDAVETLFMNMIHNGKVATFQPKIYLERSEMWFVRPLIYAYENEITKMANELQIPISKNLCGNDGNTERAHVKEILKGLYHTYPEAKDNFQLMLRNKKQVDLFNPIDHED